MELHALADVEVERVVLGELPFGGERRLDLEGRGIAMHQHVPGLMGEDQAGALAVEVHVDVGHGIDELDAQRVGALLGEGRTRQRRGGGGDRSAERREIFTKSLLLVGASLGSRGLNQASFAPQQEERHDQPS